MVSITDKDLQELVKSGAKVAAKPSEVAAILDEMKKFNSALLGIVSRPVPLPVPASTPSTPVVHVAAPSVSVPANINLETPPRRYRVTVTKRDNTAQMRIKELIFEPIE